MMDHTYYAGANSGGRTDSSNSNACNVTWLTLLHLLEQRTAETLVRRVLWTDLRHGLVSTSDYKAICRMTVGSTRWT